MGGGDPMAAEEDEEEEESEERRRLRCARYPSQRCWRRRRCTHGGLIFRGCGGDST